MYLWEVKHMYSSAINPQVYKVPNTGYSLYSPFTFASGGGEEDNDNKLKKYDL